MSACVCALPCACVRVRHRTFCVCALAAVVERETFKACRMCYVSSRAYAGARARSFEVRRGGACVRACVRAQVGSVIKVISV